MKTKRETLKKIAGVGAMTVALPNAWVKPMLSAVLLPAHAQASVTESPTVGGISCSSDTDELQAGSVITLSATISDTDTAIENIQWAIKKNGATLIEGTGQFTTNEYIVLAEDIGSLKLELEVIDDSSNTITVVFCEDAVVAQPPTVADISCSINTEELMFGTEITLSATINDTDTTIENIGWAIKKNGATLIEGTGQFATTVYTVLAEDVGSSLKFELEVIDDTGNTTTELFCEDTVISLPPTISGASCTVTGQSGPITGETITIEATISDSDTPIENITWTLNLNGSVLATGTGQFVPFNYTIVEAGGTTLTFELEARDDTGNSVNTELCQIVVAFTPG